VDTEEKATSCDYKQTFNTYISRTWAKVELNALNVDTLEKLPPPLDRGAQAEREHCTECHRWVVTGLCSAMLAGALKETV